MPKPVLHTIAEHINDNDDVLENEDMYDPRRPKKRRYKVVRGTHTTEELLQMELNHGIDLPPRRPKLNGKHTWKETGIVVMMRFLRDFKFLDQNTHVCQILRETGKKSLTEMVQVRRDDGEIWFFDKSRYPKQLVGFNEAQLALHTGPKSQSNHFDQIIVEYPHK